MQPLDALRHGSTIIQTTSTMKQRIHLLFCWRREDLLIEQRRLNEALGSLDQHFDAGVVRGILGSFSSVAKAAKPEELQRLMRLAVWQIEWMPGGEHRVHFRHFAKPPHVSGEKAGREWFHTMVHNGSP